MKKFLFILFAIVFCLQQVSFSEEIKDELYYKRQIQNQRYLYGKIGLAGAIAKKDDYTIEAFLKSGFDPNSKYLGIPIIFYTVKYKDINALNMFLDNNADPNIESMDCTLLLWSIIYKDSDAVKALIDHKVDVNKKFKNTLPLNKAISKKQTKIVEMLLSAGAKPDEKTMNMVKKSKDEYLKSLFE